MFKNKMQTNHISFLCKGNKYVQFFVVGSGTVLAISSFSLSLSLSRLTSL